jgi:hypothetical protein
MKKELRNWHVTCKTPKGETYAGLIEAVDEKSAEACAYLEMLEGQEDEVIAVRLATQTEVDESNEDGGLEFWN